jgi:hypothetical protein
MATSAGGQGQAVRSIRELHITGPARWPRAWPAPTQTSVSSSARLAATRRLNESFVACCSGSASGGTADCDTGGVPASDEGRAMGDGRADTRRRRALHTPLRCQLSVPLPLSASRACSLWPTG